MENQDNNQEIVITPEQQAEVEQQAAKELEDIERDAVAAQMAKELGQEEDEQDFDPTAAIDNMSPEQEAAALQATQDMLESQEGAEFAAAGAIDYYEELIQEHCHERFTISDKKKENGAKRLTPVIQKYAPQALGLLGSYKNEIMAALWVGSLAYGSVKQVKALKLEDAKNAEPEVEPEQAKTKQEAE